VEGDGGAGDPRRRLQYFPETLTDSKAVNYQVKDIPGGSLPLYQWVSSGAREISFTAVWTTDVDHYSQTADQESAPWARAQAITERLKAHGVEERNVWIPGALAWLRRFLIPRYGDTTEVGVPLTFPPRKILLSIPGALHLNGGGGGFSGSGGIYCVMTQCEISYESFFPSGDPRIATAQLTFAEVPQVGGRVKFPFVDDNMEINARVGFTLGPSQGRRNGG
jgi:hypothetical protein